MNEALLTEVKHDNGQNCFRDSSSISTHLFTYVPFYLYAFVTVYLFTYVPFYLFNFVSMYIFIYVPFYLWTFLPMYLFTHVPFYPCTFLSMYLMFVYLSICSSVCAFIFCIVQRPFCLHFQSYFAPIQFLIFSFQLKSCAQNKMEFRFEEVASPGKRKPSLYLWSHALSNCRYNQFREVPYVCNRVLVF